ncbi:DUF6527 family protein [Ralstonia solanacearum]|uniref:DUF6527 family protein n=1 Tax=Ralstonia solanacearum TaxID=305 RepID=UPI0004D74329|nr:DUF6527 family protein [Ralstonia solanacearum]ALF90976.1 hypothetical protein RSUY_46740 [Ralstonia solanacearum]ATI30386.1 hypothetical protein CCY86_23525 [Ralstonia solanacearum]ATJ89125.1 hypothetical protein CDC59_23405 [Ralstonia solanacearum]KFZ94010.1 hypothetical protein CR47_0211375 [Ralstonia solanacearum]
MPKLERLRLERVHYMPKVLEPGVLYASEEFGTAAHLCACGCGAKIRTPLGPTEWQLEETNDGPSLSPSVGNWQQPCRSHYWIWRGEIEWYGDWTEGQVQAGRRSEHQRRKAYFAERAKQRHSQTLSLGQRIWNFIKNLIRLR